MSARPPLLTLKDVRLADGPLALFEGVDIALDARTRACLVGRNGSGKSTLLRLLAGVQEPDSGARFVQPGTRIALLPQEPRITGAALLDYVTAGGAPSYQAEASLDSFGLDPSRDTAGLSGGEIRRAALARVLAEDPDVLLLDEPTNHLDITTIALLEERLARSRAAILTISHDRAFLSRVTSACFWLESRKVRRLDAGFGAFEAWASKLMEEEEEQLRRLTKAIERETYTFYRSITAQRTRNEGRARALQAMRAEKARRVADQVRELSVTIEAGASSGKLVADVKNISKAFGDRVLFRGLTTRILRGDRLAIVGPNGAGKTTLVKVLLGELAPDLGSVSLGAGLTIAYADQARAGLAEGVTLWGALAPDGGDQILVRGQPRHVAAYAGEFLFHDRQLRQPVSSLSGGERNRLLLAIALARPANVLVLDEPTNDLDMDTLDLLEEALAEYDGTLILVSHDRDFIDRLATSTLALDGRGSAVETPGGWSDFLDQNPDFLAPRPLAPPARKPPQPVSAPPASRPARLSYKDQRRLDELERLIPTLQTELSALEERLGDPAHYGQGSAQLKQLTSEHEALGGKLRAAEDEWLTLEQKREALSRG